MGGCGIASLEKESKEFVELTLDASTGGLWALNAFKSKSVMCCDPQTPMPNSLSIASTDDFLPPIEVRSIEEVKVVLEWLGGGSLNTILSQNQAKPGLAQKLFRRPTFTYANLLSKARDMAEALDFLHARCHPGATVIHRGD